MESYIDAQMFKVAPLPLQNENYPYGFDLLISSQGRKTNHIRIDAEMMQKIENILRGIE